MTPTPQEVARQLPNPYTTGVWYPVKLPGTLEWEARKTQGKGQNRGIYIHIRCKVDRVIRSPDGTELSRYHKAAYIRARAKFPNGEWVRID